MMERPKSYGAISEIIWQKYGTSEGAIVCRGER